MKTLTITDGRRRLGYWLKKAVQGEGIGFIFEGKVVALRPVEVDSIDYALQEWRLIFTARKGLLTFDFAGDHDEVQNYLRSKR